VALIEQAARYQERTVACLRSGRRPDGSLDRRAVERAIAELSAAIDCLRQASELADDADTRKPLEATLRQREEERRSLEVALRRRS
jgi:alpha-D-ribose 1-methylphosphonate 5-triphosphate synthase subunit PhnG